MLYSARVDVVEDDFEGSQWRFGQFNLGFVCLTQSTEEKCSEVFGSSGEYDLVACVNWTLSVKN